MQEWLFESMSAREMASMDIYFWLIVSWQTNLTHTWSNFIFFICFANIHLNEINEEFGCLFPR